MKLKFLLGLGCVFLVLATVAVKADAPVVDITESDAEHSQSAIGQTPVEPSSVDEQTPQTPPETNSDTPENNNPDSGTAPPPATTPNNSSFNESSATPEERIGRLEQQMSNLTNMNWSQQLNDLQQQVAQLRGQLQVQAHDVKLLNSQLHSFYQDLDQRLNQLKNTPSGAPVSSEAEKSATKDVTSPDKNVNLQESNEYQGAFNALTAKQYERSKTAFQNYLKHYPNGRYAANSHYWLGEMYLSQGVVDKASQEFEVVNRFSHSEKIPEAKLKLAIIYSQTGKIPEARSQLMHIKSAYPDSTAAQLATIRLQQLDLITDKSVDTTSP